MDKLKLAQRTIAMLSSMIESGECHTTRSREMKDNALNGLNQLNIPIPDIITRLQKLQRFDLDNYREGEYDIETEREEKEDGEYVDAYEIDRLIKDLTNGL